MGSSRMQGRADKHLSIGAGIGVGVGLVVGTLVGGIGIPVGIAIGAGAGVAVGAAMDARRMTYDESVRVHTGVRGPAPEDEGT